MKFNISNYDTNYDQISLMKYTLILTEIQCLINVNMLMLIKLFHYWKKSSQLSINFKNCKNW